MAFVFVGGDDALGAAFGELFEAVLRSMNEVVGFKPIFSHLEFTINLITPIIKKKELDHPKEELGELIKQLKEGKEIVLKCSNASWLNPYNRAKYTKKLLDLDYRITRFLTIIYEVPDPLDFTVGLDVPLKELKLWLLKDGKQPMLVLSGAGGCGKTTLAKMLCQDGEIKGKFRDNIFFVNVSDTPRPSLKVIIQKLFQHMCSQAPEFQNDGDAVNRLEQLLKQIGPDPVLLVLDDVWSGSESLLEKFLFQIPDYKILVTSRSEFPRFGSTYRLKFLNDEDSVTLLRNSAFPQNGTFYEPDEDLLNEIVRVCNGIPLTLAMVGTSLRGRPDAVWQNAVMELSDGQSNFYSQSDTRYRHNGVFIVDDAEGRKIGDLIVSNKEIAKGSNGTVVFEGTYLGLPVAVKRLVLAHHGVASKEIQNLIETDRHQNIVRFYREEKNQDFVYLALERCTCSLADLIQIYSQNTQFSDEYEVRLDSVKDIIGDINLWKTNRRPSPLLIKLMRNVVSGLVHLHKKGFIHGDLKPQNVLIIKEESLLAKLSDMGISKRLQPDKSSLGHQGTVCGSLGWRAPEQILDGRQTRALDLFSLGCVLFFCITGGRNPFGHKHLERESNIEKNQVDLSAVECIPEATDLFSKLLVPHPELRPKALQVFHHPLLWDSTKRLSFVRDTSNRAESTDEDLSKALENIGPLTFGEQWDTKMDRAFIDNILLYRSYDFKSVRDLLRVMRNKWAHYEELPKEIKEILGPDPEGFDDYFASRFPKLLIEAYEVVYQYCKEEERFHEYFKSKV